MPIILIRSDAVYLNGACQASPIGAKWTAYKRWPWSWRDYKGCRWKWKTKKKLAATYSGDNHNAWSKMSPDQMCDCVRIRSGCQCLQFLPRPQTHDMMVAGVLLMMRMMIMVVHAKCRMNLYKLLRHRGQAPETQPTYQSAMHKYTRGHCRGASQPQGSDKVEVKQYQTHPRDRIIPIHHEKIHTGQPK